MDNDQYVIVPFENNGANLPNAPAQLPPPPAFPMNLESKTLVNKPKKFGSENNTDLKSVKEDDLMLKGKKESESKSKKKQKVTDVKSSPNKQRKIKSSESIKLNRRLDEPFEINFRHDYGILIIISILSMGFSLIVVATITVLTRGHFKHFE